MGKVKIAIATKGQKGLEDEVADFFAKATTFTIVTVDGKKAHLEVIKNPATDAPRGRGRIVVRMLKDKGVEKVVASEFGLAALALIEKEKIVPSQVRSGTRVGDIIRDKLYKKFEL